MTEGAARHRAIRCLSECLLGPCGAGEVSTAVAVAVVAVAVAVVAVAVVVAVAAPAVTVVVVVAVTHFVAVSLWCAFMVKLWERTSRGLRGFFFIAWMFSREPLYVASLSNYGWISTYPPPPPLQDQCRLLPFTRSLI